MVSAIGKHTTNTSQYLLRLSPAQKERLIQKSEHAGISLADALRIGGERYLDELIAGRDTPAVESDPLVNQFYVLAAQIDARLKGR